MTQTKHFNEVELGALGLVVAQATGVFDSPDMETSDLFIPGRDWPCQVDLYRKPVPMTMHCVVSGTDHADLVSTLQTLRNDMDTGLGYVELKLANRPGERIFARSRGWDLSIDHMPFGQRVVEFDWKLDRYPWWEDATENMAVIDEAMLSFLTATLEGATLVGWDPMNNGVLALDTSNAYSGTSCMKVTAAAAGDGAVTALVSGVTAGVNYAFAPYLKSASGSTAVTLKIEWFDVNNVGLSNATLAKTITTSWNEYLMSATAPTGATQCRVGIYATSAAASFYADRIGLAAAEAGLSSEDIMGWGWFSTDDSSVAFWGWEPRVGGSSTLVFTDPYDADTTIYNTGSLNAYPTYTCRPTADLASGLYFTVDGHTFTYEGALTTSDVLVVTTDVQDVTLNGTRAFADVAGTAEFPLLAPGSNLVLKSSDYTLTVTWRARRP